MIGADVDKLLDKALADAAFLGRLTQTPHEAASELGVTLSVDEIETFKGMSSEDIRAFAADYRATTDPDKRRAAC